MVYSGIYQIPSISTWERGSHQKSLAGSVQKTFEYTWWVNVYLPYGNTSLRLSHMHTDYPAWPINNKRVIIWTSVQTFLLYLWRHCDVMMVWSRGWFQCWSLKVNMWFVCVSVSVSVSFLCFFVSCSVCCVCPHCCRRQSQPTCSSCKCEHCHNVNGNKHSKQ